MSEWWIGKLYQSGQYTRLISWIFWVIFSITLHELAHGWAALRQGDPTPRQYGRMTWNPLVHMGPWSLLVFAIIGIAWGLMPTDPSRYRSKRKGRIYVSGAGPAMNILLAIIALTLAAIWTAYGPQNDPIQTNVEMFLFTGGWLNIVLAVFNMLPVPPLDGASVLAGFSRTFYRWMQNPRFQMVGMMIFLVIFFSGCFGLIFYAARNIADLYISTLAGILP